MILLGALQELRAKRRLGKAALALEILAALVPAPLLDAVDADGSCTRERWQQEILAQDAVLLAPHEDLAGKEENVGLAAILDNQLRNRRPISLGNDERARLPRLVERGDVEGRRVVLCGEPEDEERAMGRRLAHARRAQPALQIRADLTTPEGLVGIRRLTQYPDPVCPRPGRSRDGSEGTRAASDQELPTPCLHVPSPPGPGRAFGRLDRAGRGKSAVTSAWR